MNFYHLSWAIYLTALYEHEESKRQWFHLNRADLQRTWWSWTQPNSPSDLVWRADIIATRYIAERFKPAQEAAE